MVHNYLFDSGLRAISARCSKGSSRTLAGTFVIANGTRQPSYCTAPNSFYGVSLSLNGYYSRRCG